MISLSFLFSLLLAVLPPAGQDLKTPKKTEVYRPALVDEVVFTETMTQLLTDRKYGQTGTGRDFKKTYWDVYSDRDGNVTYKTNRVKDAYGKLAFRQKVRIARIQNHAALVYAVPDTETTFPEIPKDVQWLGWVPMDRLLLWDKAPVTDEGLDVKVLLNWKVADTEDLFSVSPTKDSPIAGRDQAFYYLVKKEKDMMLLSRKPEAGTDASNLCGWVSGSSVILWKTRLALEPEWEPDLVEMYSGSGFGPLLRDPDIVSDTPLKSVCGKMSFRTQTSSGYDEFANRLAENDWRFPLKAMVGTEDMDEWTFCLPSDSRFLSNDFRVSSPKGKRQCFRTVQAEAYDLMGRPYLHRVALYSEDELDDMLTSLKPLHEVSMSSILDRDRIYKTFLSMVSDNPSVETKPEKYGVFDALRIMEGLPGLSDAYPGPPIESVKDAGKLPPAKMERLLSDISQRYRKLLAIRQAVYPYTSLLNGTLYYWIPLEYLP